MDLHHGGANAFHIASTRVHRKNTNCGNLAFYAGSLRVFKFLGKQSVRAEAFQLHVSSLFLALSSFRFVCFTR